MKRTIIGIFLALAIFFSLVAQSFALVANTCTSSTGIVTGTDPTFILTYKPQTKTGVILYLKFTPGAAETLTVTFQTQSRVLGAQKYSYLLLTGAAASAYTITAASAATAFRIPLDLTGSENRLIVTIVFSAATQSGVVVANIVE